MKKYPLRVFAAAALALGAAACIIPVYVDDPGGFPRSAPPMFTRTVALERGGAIALENPVGDVEIYGWDRNEVEVSAEAGWGRAWERRIGLYGSGGTVPAIDVEKTANLVRIKPRDGRDDAESRSLRFILNVPRAVDLETVRVTRGRISIGDLFGKARLDLDEGDVRVENYSGSLEVMVRSGSVDAELLDLRSEDEVRITCRRGPVTVFLESKADAKVDLGAPNGRIASDFDLKTATGEKTISTVLGRGGATIRLTALEGNVSLRKVK